MNGHDSGLTNTDTVRVETQDCRQGQGVGNLYTFSPGVTLNAGTTYYFFTAGTMSGGISAAEPRPIPGRPRRR